MEFNYLTLCSFLIHNTNFSWSRWGDGEFNCIFGMDGCNCDGHEYFPDLGKRLERILENQPKYYIGLQELAIERYKGVKRFDDLIKMNNWTSTEILHNASEQGELNQFIKCLQNRKIMLVGPHWLLKLPLKLKVFIDVPTSNCWKNYLAINDTIYDTLEPNMVVLYSAGMMSNVLIDMFADTDITQIDTGSVFDPYCGKMSRDYHERLKTCSL
jgi:hypothetical protein